MTLGELLAVIPPATYDTLAAVVNELDERAAIMEDGQTSARMWTE